MLAAMPGLIAGEEMHRRAPPRLILEIDVGERLSVVIADDEAGVGSFSSVG